MIETVDRIVVFGTGALATRLGWHLAHSGATVTFVGTWTAALDAFGADGVGLDTTGDGRVRHEPARAARLGQAVGPAPLVLVLVKSHRTPAIAAHAVAAAEPGGLVLSLQNGLGNLEALQEARREAGSTEEARREMSRVEEARGETGSIEEARGETGSIEEARGETGSIEVARREAGSTEEARRETSRVQGARRTASAADPAAAVALGIGITALGSTSIGPGRARAGGAGETVLGAPPDMPPRARAIVEGLAARLRSEGLAVRTAPDVDALVWRKLAVNCAINPLSAILRVPNGHLLEDAAARARLRAAAGEVAAVAAALGIDAGTPEALADMAETVARNTAGNRSSMLQDIDRGAPTEIDALCGAVVRHARSRGIAAPINAALWREVTAIESRATREAYA